MEAINVPNYIKQGQLYKELKEVNHDDDSDSFLQFVSTQFVFFPSEIKTEQELKQFIEVLKYWSVDPEFVPIFFFAALINSTWTNIKEQLDSYDPEIFIMYENQGCLAGRGLLDYAIKVQNLDPIYYLKVTMNVIVIFSWELYKMAIKHNALKSFIYLETVIYKRDQPILDNSIYECCCYFNCIEILQHIFTERSLECNFDDSIRSGIFHQSYECLKFLLSKGVTYSRTHLILICRSSNVDMLSLFLSFPALLKETNRQLPSNTLTKHDINNLIFAATGCGKVEIVRYILNSFDKTLWETEVYGFNVAHQAISANNMEILDLLIIYGFPCNEETIAVAARKGNLEAMRLLRSYGCPWNEECLREAALNRNEECFMFAFENGCPRPKICVF